MIRKSKSQKLSIAVLFFTPFLFSCSDSDPAVTERVVSVVVTHLNDSGTVVLQNNGGDNLSVKKNGTFSFDKAIAVDEDYEVTVKTQPTNQTCQITDGSGTIGDSDPEISVVCGKVIFITDATTDGSIGAGGVEAADSFCNSDDNKPDDSKTYKAILTDEVNRRACTSAFCSSRSGNRDWVLSPNTTYVRSTNTIIGTTNGGGIFDLDTDTLLNSYASGPQVFYWTGVVPDWTVFDSCLSWSDNTNGNNGSFGSSDAVNADAIATFFAPCDSDFHLACAEQ
jgi:hypothetical protein